MPNYLKLNSSVFHSNFVMIKSRENDVLFGVSKIHYKSIGFDNPVLVHEIYPLAKMQLFAGQRYNYSSTDNDITYKKRRELTKQFVELLPP